MASEGNDFNINLGDTIYSDSEVGGVPVARTVPQKWAKYRLGLELPALRSLRRSAALYSHWDDHEFVNDFSRPEHGEALYRAGTKAFRDYAPVTYTSADGLYRTFRWGRNLELFFLDERSFREREGLGRRHVRQPADARAAGSRADGAAGRAKRVRGAGRAARATRRACLSRPHPAIPPARCWAAASTTASPRRCAPRPPSSR